MEHLQKRFVSRKAQGKLVPPAAWLAENVSACTEETAELDLLVFHLICTCSSPADRLKKTLNLRQAGSVKASYHGIQGSYKAEKFQA